MEAFLALLTGVSPGDRLSPKDKLIIAASMGLNALPGNIILSQGPYIFEAYYKAPVAAIGFMGTMMGFYNMANGVPIAAMADRGTLNSCASHWQLAARVTSTRRQCMIANACARSLLSTACAAVLFTDYSRCSRCAPTGFPNTFPIDTWGRRAPWIVIGLPINALAACMVLYPPMDPGSDWIAIWYGLVLAVYFTGHTASTQQYYALPQELCANKKEVASLFSLVGPAYLLSNQLQSYIPILIYAVRPTVGGAMNCCADPYTDCSAAPNCGCYLASDDPMGGANGAGFLEKDYLEACPASEYSSFESRASACSVPQDGRLGSVGLVAVLIGGLSMGALWSLPAARRSPMRPVEKSQQLSFTHSVVTTVKNDSFLTLTACMFSEASAVSIDGVFNSFFLTYSVGLDSAEMGATMAHVGMLLNFMPLFTIPLFRHMLKTNKIKPWNLCRFNMLFQAFVGPPLYLMVTKDTLWPLYMNAAIFGLAGAGGSMANEMMRGWTMDDDEMNTGQRREGILLSVNAVFQFFSTTLSLGAVSAFSLTGYDPEICAYDQPDAAKATSRWIYIFGVAAVKLIYFLAMSRWPIQGERLAKMEAWIKEHGQAGKQQANHDTAGAVGGSSSGVGSATLTHDYSPSHDRGLASKAGEAVTVLRTEPEWVRVRNANGQEGWIPEAFLKIQMAAGAGGEPSLPPPPAPQGELGQGLVAADSSVTAL
jgi:Na+/melibiose symporter-like transporter